MGKYAALIDRLDGGPKKQGNAYFAAEQQLREADRRAFRPLVRALLQHPVADVRETVAEILAYRREVSAIPYLLEAVVDADECVRMDAIWSIERILRFEPGGLEEWLDIDYREPSKNKHKLSRFLQKNRTYISANLFDG